MKSTCSTVSIIIPVYNAAKTLHVCLASLQAQTYAHLELLFINDSSTDGSLEILEAFSEAMTKKDKTATVKIISHRENRGVARARNTGLDHATGTYLYYVDADDKIKPETIALLVQKAVDRDADIVGCNWFLSFEKSERKMNQSAFSTARQAVERILRGSMRWNLWLFLVKRSLYEDNNVRFLPGMNMGEDLMVMIKLFTFARAVSFVDSALYHYGQSNTASITKIYADRHIEEVTRNVEEVQYTLEKHSFGLDIQELMYCLKLNIKLPLLISNKTKDYKRWRRWYPEANSHTMQNKKVSLRIRILQWCAVRKLDWVMQIHYYLVVRFVYGVLYR